MQQRVILHEHSVVVVPSCPSRLADFSKYPLHSLLSVPPARIYPPALLASGQARSWFHADGRANELWGTHRHVLGGLLIKLGNNEWTNTPAASALVCAPQVSFVPSLSLSSHLLALSISLFSSHLIPYSGVPRMCVQAKAHHGGVGYQTRSRLPSAGFSFFLSLSSSLLSVLPPPFIFLPSCLSLPILYNCPIFLFLLFFSSTSRVLLPSLFLPFSLSIFPTWQPSWGMCSVIERTIQNNNKLSPPLPLTFHLLPPSPAIYIVSDRIARGNEGFPLRAESLFRSFLHSTIFPSSPLSAVLSVSPHLAMSQSERVCA